MKSAVISMFAIASLFAVSVAYTQESIQCDGIVSILRISNYVDSGSEKGLREASEKHDAWYKSHWGHRKQTSSDTHTSIQRRY